MTHAPRNQGLITHAPRNQGQNQEVEPFLYPAFI